MLNTRRIVQQARVGNRARVKVSRWQNEQRRWFGGYEDSTEYDEDFDEESGHARLAGDIPQGHGLFMGTVVAKQAAGKVDLQDLISCIEPRSRGKSSRPNRTPSLLLLLLTPSFASRAVDSSLPLEILSRLRSSATIAKSCDVITAVVDRLPVPESSAFGREGLAYALITDPAPLYADSHVTRHPGSKDTSSLLFEIPPSKDHGRPDITTLLEVPLASTDHTNGLPSTLLHAHYKMKPGSQSLYRMASNHLISQTIRLPFAAYHNTLSYRAPLVPLTTFRTIEGSRDNVILRTQATIDFDSHEVLFSGRDKDFIWDEERQQYVHASELGFPAAREVKSRLRDYFCSTGVGRYRPDVWALVVPWRPAEYRAGSRTENQLKRLHAHDIERLWPRIPSRDSYRSAHRDKAHDFFYSLRSGRFFGSFRAGARLFKVLSRRDGHTVGPTGSLTLDPSVQHLGTSEMAGDPEQLPPQDEDLVAMRQPIMEEGEIVMFFISRSSDTDRAVQQGLLVDVEKETEQDAIIFGVIPRDGDAVYEETLRQTDREKSDQVVHYADRFGALSMKGLAITVTDSAQKHSSVPTRTKLDVPFGRVGLGMEPASMRRDNPAFGDFGEHPDAPEGSGYWRLQSLVMDSAKAVSDTALNLAARQVRAQAYETQRSLQEAAAHRRETRLPEKYRNLPKLDDETRKELVRDGRCLRCREHGHHAHDAICIFQQFGSMPHLRSRAAQYAMLDDGVRSADESDRSAEARHAITVTGERDSGNATFLDTL